MKTKFSSLVTSTLFAVMATTLCTAPAVAVDTGAPRIAQPGSNAYGHTLAEWLGVYWRWALGSAQDMTQSTVGKVQLMPLPAGAEVPDTEPPVYRGSLEITLRPGTPFVLPLASLIGERYNCYPACPDDPKLLSDEELLAGIQPALKIDGVTVISESNKRHFYVPFTPFDPPVYYPVPTDYGSVAATYHQSMGIVSPPLPVGRHVIHLVERYKTPYWDWVYDNTWIVTVSPK